MDIGISHYNYSNIVYLLLVVIVLVQSADVLKKGSKSGNAKEKKGSCVKGFKRQCLRGSGLPYRDAKRIFKKFKPNEAPKPDTVRIAKERNLTRGDSDINDAFEKWKTAKGLDDVDEFTVDQIEELAVFAYQENPFVNHYFRKLYYSASLDPRLKNLDKMNAATDEAILIQSYLKKHQIPEATTVYRFESDFNPNRYKVGEKFTEKTFLSTAKSNDRNNIRGLMNSPRFRPREIEIRNLRVGADIEAVNPRFRHQREILIPFGTKFRTRSIEEGNVRTLERWAKIPYPKNCFRTNKLKFYR